MSNLKFGNVGSRLTAINAFKISTQVSQYEALTDCFSVTPQSSDTDIFVRYLGYTYTDQTAWNLP